MSMQSATPSSNSISGTRSRESRYQSIDNTIVQWFIPLASVLITPVERLRSKCSRRTTGSATQSKPGNLVRTQSSHSSCVIEWRGPLKRLTFFSVVAATSVALVALIVPAPSQSDGQPAPPFVTEMPHGYRDWRWISSTHEAGNLNSTGALLGNDAAFKAFRDGKLPLPDGSIIAALHYKYVPSDENNKVFGQVQSFVPGAPTNIQFMVKDSTKYAATGGWGFGHFVNGKPAGAASMKSCFPCHERNKESDLVFTHYAP